MRETSLDTTNDEVATAEPAVSIVEGIPLIQPQSLAWDKMGGLIPVVVQDAQTLQVLMLGYMNQSALAETMRTGNLTFYSRSRQLLWEKGETSGYKLKLLELIQDCDSDSLLALVQPSGPVCHRMTTSCFGSEDAPGIGILGRLIEVIEDRKEREPSDSYTAELLGSGTHRIAQKVGEEGVEVALAAVNQTQKELNEEVADLIYHLLILLSHKEIPLVDCLSVLRERLIHFGKQV